MAGGGRKDASLEMIKKAVATKKLLLTLKLETPC